MKTIHRGLALLTFALLLTLPLSRALAINVSESTVGDFPNSQAAVTATYTYTLTKGNNVFSGQIAFGSGDADFFKVVVPAGLRVTAITPAGTSASSFTLPTPPLSPGTYTCACNPGQILSTINWTITILVEGPPDYDVTTGAVITLTNNSNQGDTLTVSEPSAGMIGFAASSRTFSVNGGPNTSNASSSVSYAGIDGVVINGGSGGETINVGAFSGSSFPSLTINGGAGNDTVNFTGNITFASDKNLTVNLQSGASPGSDAISVSSGAQLIASGAGIIDLECSRSVSITGGAVLQTEDGNLTVMANQQATATAGNFTGVTVDGAGTKLQVTALGALTVKGRGGNDPGGFQLGVNVNGGAQIISFGPAPVNVTGTGGASTGIVNRGVTIYGAGSAIISGGDVNVIGTAGAQGSGYSIGVSVLYGGKINGYGFDTYVIGTGGGTSGGSNQGIEIGGAVSGATPASIVTGSGVVHVFANPGTGASVGLYMSDAGAIGSAPTVFIYADSLSIDATATISASTNYVAFGPSAATHVDLGGPGSAGTLGLSDAILDRVTASKILVYVNADIIISAPITRASGTDLYLKPNGGGLRATASGTDLDLAGGTFYLLGPLAMPITGAAPDTNFPQLHVNGGVGLGPFNEPAALDLTGTTFAGAAGQKFTILKNDGGAAISGTFENLPEGALLTWPGSALFYAQISYLGGSGHDVVLTLVNASSNVTNTANDTSPGSLRAAITYAAAHSGADTVTFDPSLNGQTISLDSQITLSDTAALTIDASSLSNGLTISGGGSTLLFEIANGSNVTLKSLGIANGHTGGNGGSILNDNGATLAANNCTFIGGSCSGAGGAISNLGGMLTVQQSTFSGNSAGFGGAIYSQGPLVLTQSTISGNTAFSNGGGIFLENSTATLANDIIAGNSASAGRDMVLSGLTLTRVGASVIGDNTGAATQFPAGAPNANGDYVGTAANPLNAFLAPLDNYGGPTRTMALQPGSPARNAAVGSSVTSDQRFFPIVGTPDIGAYEAGTTGTNYNAYIWENLPAGTAVSPQHDTNFDYDGDGVTNFNEYLAQTNASLSSSYLHIMQFTFGSSTANVTFPSVLGRHYTVEAALSLAAPISWSPVSGTLTGTGNPITYSGSFSGFSKIFLRVRVGP